MSLTLIYRKLQHLWRVYGTRNNILLAVALIIAAGWAWGTVSVMQTNFTAQKRVDTQRRELELTQLEVDTLKYQQNYYNSDEYKDLAARQNLGLVKPGEKVLILPPNSSAAQAESKADELAAQGEPSKTIEARGNVAQWFDFFSGKAANSLQE